MKKLLLFLVITVVIAVQNVPASAMSWSSRSTSVVVTQGSSTVSTSSVSSTTTSGTSQPCLSYQGHLYEVCSAYIFNSQLGALLPYYKYAHSGNLAAGKIVSNHLEQRYSGQALQTVVQRVRSWPIGPVDVAVPRIRIISATSNLATNSATLITEESWQVRAKSGAIIYQETNARHTISIQRVPSYVLHKWVVTSINP